MNKQKSNPITHIIIVDIQMRIKIVIDFNLIQTFSYYYAK